MDLQSEDLQSTDLQSAKGKSARILTQVSLLMALAIVVKLVFSPILVVGGAMVRINASLVFSQLIPILFGPVFGGISGAIMDLIAFAIRPQGAWLWHMTLIEVLCGLLLGVLWKVIRMKGKFAKLLVVILITDIIYTALNTWGFILFLPSMQGAPFLAMLIPRLVVTLGLVIPKVYIMMILINIYESYIKAT